MRASRITTRLLVGGGAAAFVLLAGASAAGAANPPGLRPVISASPTSPGTDPSPTWSFSDPKGDPTTCSLALGATTVFGPTSCTGSVTYDLTGHNYGTYTFTVDNGKASATDTYSFVPAAPTITTSAPSPDNDTTPTWSFTLPSGTTGRCTLTSGGATVAGPATCSGSQTYTLAADGTYTFSVVATGDGVDSAATTRTYTLDTTAPPAPAITAAPAAVSNDDTPTWTYTVGTGTAVTRCSVTSGGSTIFAAAPCTSPKTFDLTTQPDGTYTFTVTAFDGVGNASPSASDTYVLQRITPPAAPVITASPASPDNDNTPTWSFTLPAGTTGECLLLQGSTVVSGPVACSASQTFTIAADGNYLFRVSAIDTITNARSLPTTSTTYTLDRVAPAASTFSGTPATPGKVLTPKWTFTTPAGAATLECTLKRGTTVISAPAPCAGTFQPNLAGKPDGTYTLTVVAIDAAGNRSPGLTGTYTLDTVPPAAPRITNGPSGLTTTSSPAWTFTTDPATTSTCKLEQGRTVISAAKPCSGSTSYDLTGRVDGTYTFTVVSTDTAGNVGPSTVVNITVDRTAPGKPTITSGPASTSNDTTPTWTFTPAAGTTLLRCTVSQGATVVVAPTPCTSPATFDLNAFPDGTYTFGVVAYDAAANASPAATSIYTLRTTRVLPPPPPPPTPTPTPTPNPRPTPSPAAVTVTPTPVPAAVSTLPPPSLGPGEPGRPNRIVAAPKPVRPAIKLPDGEPGLTTPTTEAPLPPPAGIVEAAGRVVTEASRGAAFPLLLVALVILFLAIQDQIDRRDPKLSDAPVHAGEELEFGPPPSRRGT